MTRPYMLQAQWETDMNGVTCATLNDRRCPKTCLRSPSCVAYGRFGLPHLQIRYADQESHDWLLHRFWLLLLCLLYVLYRNVYCFGQGDWNLDRYHFKRDA